MITPEIIAAFESGNDIELRRLLGLRPWEISPLRISGSGKNPFSPTAAGFASWPKAKALRKQLQAATRSAGGIEKEETA